MFRLCVLNVLLMNIDRISSLRCVVKLFYRLMFSEEVFTEFKMLQVPVKLLKL